MTTLADQELGRVIGRLEARIEVTGEEVTALEARVVRTEDKVNRLAKLAVPFRRDIDNLHIEARARGAQTDDQRKRIEALEAPVEQARKDSAGRRDRMRLRVKQVGAALGGIFVLVEWVAKPIVGLIAESWWHGKLPPGH